MDHNTLMIIWGVAILVWCGIGSIGDFIRNLYFGEPHAPENVLLGPVSLIMSAIEALIIMRRRHKIEKARKEIHKPLDEYEKRAIARINKILQI